MASDGPIEITFVASEPGLADATIVCDMQVHDRGLYDELFRMSTELSPLLPTSAKASADERKAAKIQEAVAPDAVVE